MFTNKQWANKLILISTVSVLVLSAACRFKTAQHNITPEDLAQLDNILRRTRNIDSLSVLAETYENAGNKEGAIKIFQKLGRLSRESDDFVKAIEFHNRALSLAEERNDTNEIISCLNQIGTNYRRIGAYEDAATFHYKALRYSEQQCDTTPEVILKNKVTSLNGIGNIYLMLDNLDAAHTTFLSALEGEKQLSSDLGMAINYANIGSIFESKAMYDSARVYYEHSMEHNRIANSALGISLCHNHFGHLAELQGNFDEALREYHAAYDIMEKGTDRWHWMEACLSIIRVNIAKDDLKTAAVYIDRAEATAGELRSNDYLTLVYKTKYSYFEKKGDFRRALDNYIISHHYADSTLNLKNVNHIHNLRVLYETERKEVEITALKNEKQLMRWLAISGAALFLLIIIVFFFLWRWTTQKKRLAEQRIIQLQQEKQLIATQAVLDGEVQERTRLARDLHDGLGSILAAAKYNLVDIKNTSDREVIDVERFDKAVNLLDESMREMRRVAHHLMPDSLSNSGLKQSITDFCNSVPHVKFTYYGDETRLDPKLEVMIYHIMHELVSNALKHSGAEHILVEIVRYDDKIALTVQDDGCGFDDTTESEGMGLSNIRTRVAAYNGNLLIDSKVGVGTEVNVELRITN